MSFLPSHPSAALDPLSLVSIVLRQGWADNLHDAEDLCQEGELRMLAAKARGKEIRNPHSYLRRAIWSAAVDVSRRPKITTLPMNEVEPMDPADPLRAREIAEAVHHFMMTLTRADRELIRRHGMQEESFESIGRDLGCSAATVYRRWNDAAHHFATAISSGDSRQALAVF